MAAPLAGFKGPFWRVFPWDASAAPGEPFTPQYVLPAGAQTGGRFDLSTVPIVYIALEDPAHALAEVLQPILDAMPDLGDPEALVRFGIRPDNLSSRDRAITQRISRTLHDDFGVPGFRWWSAFGGQWHVAVLYMDRVDRFAIRYGTPDPLHLGHPVVHAAAEELKMHVAKK